MLMYKQIGFWLLVSILLPHTFRSACGQPPPFRPAEERTGFFAFLLLHNALTAEIERKRLTDADLAAGLERCAQATLGVTATDFSTITAVSGRVRAELEELWGEGDRYVESVMRSGTRPDPLALRGLERRKERLIDAAVTELQSKLTPAGWIALRKYTSEEVWPRIRTKEVKHAG